MAVTHGARTEVLEQISESFGRDAQTIEQVHTQATRAVTRLAEVWRGPDSSRYATRWAEQERALLEAGQRLAEMARQLRQQAAQQDQTSNGQGFGPTAPAGPGAPTHPPKVPANPGHPGISEQWRGTEPKPEDLVAWNLAWNSYENNQRMEREGISPPPLPEGWHKVDPKTLDLPPGVVTQDPRTGFQASIFVSDEGQYVIAYRGSDENLDWPQNFAQGAGYNGDLSAQLGGFKAAHPHLSQVAMPLVGLAVGGPLGMGLGIALAQGDNAAAYTTSQYQQAMALGVAMKDKVGADNLAMTGHSLGGGLASTAAMATGVSAVTFDAAGPSTRVLQDAAALRGGGATPESLLAESKSGQIRAYRMETDVLTNFQEKWGLSGVAPDAAGTTITMESPGVAREHEYAQATAAALGPAGLIPGLAPTMVAAGDLFTGQGVKEAAIDYVQALYNPVGESRELGAHIGEAAGGHHWETIDAAIHKLIK